MRLFSVRSSLEGLSSSSSDSDSESDSGSILGPLSVRTSSIDVNHHPTHDAHISDDVIALMHNGAEQSTPATKGKGKMCITDEDFARSVFAEEALTQFEEYSRGLRWGRNTPLGEKDRVLEEFLEDQAFLNTEELVANLAATLRPLQADEMRRRSPSTDYAGEDEEEIEHNFLPTPRIMPTVIPMWSRSNERDDQPICCACRSQITGKLVKLDCGSKYDTECLMQMFEANVNDEYRFPPRCCGVVVPLRHVQDQLPKATLELYKAKIEEYSTPSRLYCSNAQCAHFLGSRKCTAGSVSCEKCQTETCARCTAPHHPQSKRCKVDKGVRAALQLGQTNGWQRCPQCRQLVERHDGCYHMSCRCGMQFCYLCAGNWGHCKCWKRRFFLKALLMRWLHLRGNYLVKDEPAAKKGENSVTRLCKRSWNSVKKAVTPPNEHAFSSSTREATIASESLSASASVQSLDIDGSVRV